MQSEKYTVQVEIRTRMHDAPVLFVLFPNNETFKKSVIFSCRGANAWNMLLVAVRNITTFESFKSMLKTKLKDSTL